MDLRHLLKQAQENGQKTLIAVHHGMAEIHRVMEQAKKGREHWWWDSLSRWVPTATRILNQVLHPVVILLMLILLIFVLIIALYVKVWVIMKQLAYQLPPLIVDNPCGAKAWNILKLYLDIVKLEWL